MICPKCRIATSDEASGFHHCKYEDLLVTYRESKILEYALIEFLYSFNMKELHYHNEAISELDNTLNSEEIVKLINDVKELDW